MLKRLNNFIRNVIKEAAGDDPNEEKKIKELYHSNDFYNRFLEQLAKECDVVATKQRENCFLIYGILKNIEAFFTKLKVDDTFMDNPADFVIYSPMFSYGETAHNLKMDEDYPIYRAAGMALQTHEVDNVVRQTIHGRWYPMFEEKPMGEKVKAVKPAEITKYFKETYPKADKNFNEETEIYVEFQVNCEDWPNQIYDEMSEYAKEPDEMNDAHNEDPDDFDYTVLNVKNLNDDNVVKAALKDVKRSSKDYTKNARVS